MGPIDMPLPNFRNDRLQAAYETSKYIVPALRQRKETQNIHQRVRWNGTTQSENEVNTLNTFGRQFKNSFVLRFGKMSFDSFPQDEVKPCFRTPCTDMMIGVTNVQV